MGAHKPNGSSNPDYYESFAEFVMELVDSRLFRRPEREAYSERELAFLNQILFTNVQRITANVDGSIFDYFSAVNFLKVIDRCELLQVEILVADVFSPNGALVENFSCDGRGVAWAHAAVLKWQHTPDVLFCGSYGISEDLLNLFS
jgi:hypothetical protein